MHRTQRINLAPGSELKQSGRKGREKGAGVTLELVIPAFVSQNCLPALCLDVKSFVSKAHSRFWPTPTFVREYVWGKKTATVSLHPTIHVPHWLPCRARTKKCFGGPKHAGCKYAPEKGIYINIAQHNSTSSLQKNTWPFSSPLHLLQRQVLGRLAPQPQHLLPLPSDPTSTSTTTIVPTRRGQVRALRRRP